MFNSMDYLDHVEYDGSDLGEDEGESLRESAKASKSGGQDEGPGSGPACQTCRKKKAKCSRQQPCSHCVKNDLPCTYDEKKGKPGMRTGAIDRLNRRVDSLENMFLGQGMLWQQVWRCLDAVNGQDSRSSPSSGTLSECTQQLKKTLGALNRKRVGDTHSEVFQSEVPKRRKVNTQPSHSEQATNSQAPFIDGTLPGDLIDSLVDIYFFHIHPWIPILHVLQFRQQLANPRGRPKLATILRAITSVCIRFCDDMRLGDPQTRAQMVKVNRQHVIVQSMENFSVENLQAMIICAFDTIGSGRGPSAWSIVGSMARTVEQLQLSVESEEQPGLHRDTQVLVKRMAFLRPCKSWIEIEERRRVFWNIFLMDRFCSIATGWNVCLTSADVKRRLPCEGALWEEGKPLHTPTPYFGVSDPPGNVGSALPTARPESADQDSIGGFAYCIEATETLSLVTSFFLQQAVDVAKHHDVQLWLVRFKQLDLRLVQWKLYLPERWREACALNADGNMDPNLTLAHITHNTAVVLLHQGIAYPSPEWQLVPIKLPSSSSVETCMAAATEVSIIAAEFLRSMQSLTNPQFAFCLFICGRMLIAHSSHYNVALPEEFDSLVNSLWEMSKRWNGPYSMGGGNLASKFALRLQGARQSGLHTLDLRQAAYSEDQTLLAAGISKSPLGEIVHDTTGINSSRYPLDTFGEGLPVAADQGATPDSITLAFPPLPLAFQARPGTRDQTAMLSPSLNHIDQTSVEYPVHDNSQLNEAICMPSKSSLDGSIALEDLTSFLDYSFLPNQRVSAFSHSAS
ncbi:fungal-specific transcription factor domain-containing protein [Pyrenochaeta sp. MPI-SDFR-AT-0127]|nr:fungal-specific transcription factor domain-containing protein [Pyrenochaeta sp. MPI-SDFR-AT-0127]